MNRLFKTLAPAGARGRLSVLAFHRVLREPDPLRPTEPTVADFEKRLRWIKAWFNVLPLAEAIRGLATGALPERPLAITFDDGYTDNHDLALPVLCKLGLPATFFIATGYLDGGRMFNDTVIEAIRQAADEPLDLRDLGLGVLELSTLDERRAAIVSLLLRLKYLPVARREALASAIAERTQAQLPDRLMMTSAQVSALHSAGMDIGGHTVSHPILSTIPLEEARSEIAEGRSRLENITGAPVRLFAYPNGTPIRDYGPEHVRLARELGFEGAVTSAWGAARAGTDIFQIPRFTPWNDGRLSFGLRLAQNIMRSAKPAPESSARLKILYHHRTASRDGQAVHIEEMVAALRRTGCEVIVVGPAAKELTGMRRLLPKAAGELLELGYNWVAYRRLRRAYLQHRPAVLYERHNLYVLAGKWLKQRFKLPYLLEVNAPVALEREQHGGLAFPRLARRLEVLVWNAADAVLPVTGILADILAGHGVPRERIHVIPNGIDPSAFQALAQREQAKTLLGVHGRLVLGFSGFVRPWHGLDRVVDFIADTKRPDLVLLVVGDGPARDSLVEHAARRGVSHQVRFTGIVKREEIGVHLAAFDIALQPAATPYASPLKLFEYLAAGCAIAAPRQPNLEEVLTHGKNAFLFSPEKPEALAEALLALVADASLRERLGSAARATAARYTWTGNAEHVVRHAQRLLGTSEARLVAATRPALKGG